MDEGANNRSAGMSARERRGLLTRGALELGGEVLRQTGRLLLLIWNVVRPVLRGGLQVALALLILLEEWGWRPLADLLGRLAKWRPWAQLEYGIAQLPPYLALVVFVLPSALLMPLKFLALFLVAKGQLVLAGLLFAAAKVVATALVARLFMLTQPALMQIGWFAWAYETVMPWKEALVERVRASWVWRVARVWKERARRVVSAQWRVWRPTVLQLGAAARAAGQRLVAQVRMWVRDIRARWATPQR